jgi:molybdenum cofactor guanylyltransferase
VPVPASTNIAGVILAGGRSSRMGGGDKCLLPLGGRPILAHVIERLRPQVSNLALNANDDPARFAPFGLPVLPDAISGFAGPLAGILTAMQWAAKQPRISHVATVAADSPFFPPDLVSCLFGSSADPERIIMSSSGGTRHPVFALWPISLRDGLGGFLAGGGRKVTEFADRFDCISVEFPLGPVGDPFFNINTPGDLAAAEAVCARLPI